MAVVQETRNEPVHVRLSSHERAMLDELVEACGFTNTSDALRYMLRLQHDALAVSR